MSWFTRIRSRWPRNLRCPTRGERAWNRGNSRGRRPTLSTTPTDDRRNDKDKKRVRFLPCTRMHRRWMRRKRMRRRSISSTTNRSFEPRSAHSMDRPDSCGDGRRQGKASKRALVRARVDPSTHLPPRVLVWIEGRVCQHPPTNWNPLGSTGPTRPLLGFRAYVAKRPPSPFSRRI